MYKGLKIRLFPNAHQKEMLELAFKNSKLIYNETIIYLKGAEDSETLFDDCLTHLQDVLISKYSDIPSETSITILEKTVSSAYQYFVKCSINKKTPILKTYKTARSFHLDPRKIDIEFTRDKKRIIIGYLGDIKISSSPAYPSTMFNVTIRKDPFDKYWFSATYQTSTKPVPKDKKKMGIGIDLGLKNCVVLSDGTKYEEPERVSRLSRKLKHLYKALGRKQKGSCNYEDQLLRIAKTKEKMTNTFTFFYNNLINELVSKYTFIVIEDLSIKEMMNKEDKLSNKFMEVKLTTFIKILKFKCKEYNVHLQTVPREYPSSQICHVCGYRNHITKDLGIREYECPNCHTTLDRDINASINILNEGKRIYLSNIKK